MRPLIMQSILLVVLLGTSLVSAEPLPASLGVLVGTWEARYKSYGDGEQFDILTIVPSGGHLSGTYQGYDPIPEDFGPWYFFVRIQKVTRNSDGMIWLTIGPRNIFEYRPKSVDEPQSGTGITNRINVPVHVQGTLEDGILSLVCAPGAPGEEYCPLGSMRVFHKRRN